MARRYSEHFLGMNDYLQMTIWAEMSLYLSVNNTVLLQVQRDSKKTWL